MSDSVFRSLRLYAALLLLVLTGASARAQVIFEDDFGAGISSIWRTPLPDYDHHNPDRGDGNFSSFVTHYVGAPTLRNEVIGGVGVLRLRQNMAPQTHIGLLTQNAFKTNNFRYEVRFNTLTQGPYSTDPQVNHSIDGFIEIGLFDPNRPGRYDVTSLFGNRYHLERTFQAMSSIDGFGNGWHNPMNEDGSTDPNIRDGGMLTNYQDNTWYKLVITGGVGLNLSARLESDSGELISAWTFSHDISAFPDGFKLSISQYMGFPIATFPVDVAVDYARLTGSATNDNRPALISLSPATATVGSGEVTVQINGSGFQPGSIARWQNQVLPTTPVSPTVLMARIPANLLTKTTTANITVLNPGTVASTNALPFRVTNATPTIRISSPARLSNVFGDGQMEIDVQNVGTGVATGVSFMPQDQTFQPLNTNTTLNAFSVQVISLPESGPQFWDGTLNPGQTVRLRIQWHVDPNFRIGLVTLRGRSPQGNFVLGQLGITFPIIGGSQ
ncbi:MAG: hypothetical protein QM758_20920 [Armatimonas sp.]